VVKAIIEGAHPVKVIREWRGMSQAALAAAAGTGVVYVSQIERRIRHASRKLRAKLAAALRVDADLLESAGKQG
jgi:transcriptional regulator with XRE-family HTH domain